jgi:NADH-quinone oxidoreductase subunit M
MVTGAAYNLWLIKRVIFGAVGNERVAQMQDLNGREFLVLGVLALAVVGIGVWPAPMLRMMEASVQHLLQQMLSSKIPGGA